MPKVTPFNRTVVTLCVNNLPIPIKAKTIDEISPVGIKRGGFFEAYFGRPRIHPIEFADVYSSFVTENVSVEIDIL